MQPAPVASGDRLMVRIDAPGPRGAGIAHVDGFVVFVPDARVGAQVRVQITKTGRTFAEAVKI